LRLYTVLTFLYLSYFP